ncbi:hypothetical protein [Devosia faecipullorum]|uniref:hypothetical protein n=1 Tax=Devosia faecipullorum TaxID=2755039 RepID=UPI00187B53B9|nr:hypothetical protein [Devosia faecipullorum]MBE7734646.1 hypothetical protein [Devosia faecipullorum]
MLEKFQAEAQYGDWSGDAAADNTIEDSIQSLLEARGQKGEGEFLVGLDLYVDDNGYSAVSAYLVAANNAEEAQAFLANADAPEVKKVTIDLTPADFVTLFKRFNVTLSWRGTDLIGRDLETGE